MTDKPFRFNNPKPGDKFVRRDGEVVKYQWYTSTGNEFPHQVSGETYTDNGRWFSDGKSHNDIIAEYTPPQEDRPKTFGEMTEAEQLALYQAENKGWPIDLLLWDGAHTKRKGTQFVDYLTYRIASEPEIDEPPQDVPKTFGEMTDAEQGALLLAHHRGQAIECWDYRGFWVARESPEWFSPVAYRIAPAPEPEVETVETVVLYGSRSADGDWIFSRGSNPDDDARITFQTIDGKIDTSAPVTLEGLK